MKRFTDQMGRTVQLENTPKRIVSLVPSQTEFLHAIGLQDEVVGITKFCIHPQEWFASKTRVGGTKKVDIKKIKELHPDLIIGNKEENTKEDIELLAQFAPVWMSEIYNFEEALQMMDQIGEIVAKKNETKHLIEQIQDEKNKLKAHSLDKRKVLYLIWENPYIACAKNTFIDNMLTQIGLENYLIHDTRYPELKSCENSTPDFVFLSSEPYPFTEKHIYKVQQDFPASKVVIVDGEMFSWYGSRMKYAFTYFNELIQSLG